jgi:rod shape-determining protein MreC
MQKRKQQTFFGIVFIIFVFIILHFIGILRPIENFFRAVIKPGTESMYDISVSLNQENELFKNIEDLKNAYISCATDITQNKIDTATFELLKQENEELKRQLNYIGKKELKTIGAQVIGKNIDPLGNTLVLDRGSESGISVNNAVIMGEGVFIGKIVRVENNTSVVRLINDNQSKIASTLINQDKSIGVVEGGYGISIRMNYIPQNETVKVGDIVITSGLEGDIPTGLMIGAIEAVEKEAYQPFQKAVITPSVDLTKIKQVSIITGF